MLSQFEKTLNKRLGAYEEDPPPSAWKKIRLLVPQRFKSAWMDAVEASQVLTIVAMLLWLAFNEFKMKSDGQASISLSGPGSKIMNADRFVLNPAGRGDTLTSPTDQLNGNKVSDSRSTPAGIISRKMQPSAFRSGKPNLRMPDDGNSKSDDVTAASRPGNSPLRQYSGFSASQMKLPVFALATDSAFSLRRDSLLQKKVIAKENGADRHTPDSPQPAPNFNSGHFYFQATPLLTYQRVASNTQDNHYVSGWQSIPDLSFKRIAIRVETGWQWVTAGRVKIGVGALYLHRTQRIQYRTQSVDHMDAVQTTSGDLVLTPVLTTENHKLEVNTSSIGVTANLAYRIIARRLINYAGFGLDYQMVLGRNIYPDQITQPTRYIFINVFYRTEYKAGDRISLYIQPTFNYTPDTKRNFSSELYVKPYGIGVGIGVIFKPGSPHE